MNHQPGEPLEHATDEALGATQTAPRTKTSTVLLLCSMALLAALAAAGASAWLWWRMSAIQQRQHLVQGRLGAIGDLESRFDKSATQNQQLAQRLDHLSKQLNGQLSGMQNRQRSLDKLTHQARDDIARLENQYKALAALQSRQAAPPSAAEVITFQRLLEVGFLLRNAQASLVLTQDPEQAVHLLTLADDQLAALGDPRWLPVRQAIAQDKAALEAVPMADTAGIALQLSAMAQQAHTWPLRASTLQGAADAASGSAPDALPTGESRWQMLRRELIGLWRRAVVITHTDSSALPFQPYLRERLALHLQLTASAAARGDQQLFAGELEQSRQLLIALDTTSPSVHLALQHISALRTVTLQPELPDLHAPVERFLHILQQQETGPAWQQGENP
jgi:uroporphyrin-3 C-methyltransferase